MYIPLIHILLGRVDGESMESLWRVDGESMESFTVCALMNHAHNEIRLRMMEGVDII